MGRKKSRKNQVPFNSTSDPSGGGSFPTDQNVPFKEPIRSGQAEEDHAVEGEEAAAREVEPGEEEVPLVEENLHDNEPVVIEDGHDVPIVDEDPSLGESGLEAQAEGEADPIEDAELPSPDEVAEEVLEITSETQDVLDNAVVPAEPETIIEDPAPEEAVLAVEATAPDKAHPEQAVPCAETEGAPLDAPAEPASSVESAIEAAADDAIVVVVEHIKPADGVHFDLPAKKARKGTAAKKKGKSKKGKKVGALAAKFEIKDEELPTEAGPVIETETKDEPNASVPAAGEDDQREVTEAPPPEEAIAEDNADGASTAALDDATEVIETVDEVVADAAPTDVEAEVRGVDAPTDEAAEDGSKIADIEEAAVDPVEVAEVVPEEVIEAFKPPPEDIASAGEGLPGTDEADAQVVDDQEADTATLDAPEHSIEASADPQVIGEPVENATAKPTEDELGKEIDPVEVIQQAVVDSDDVRVETLETTEGSVEDAAMVTEMVGEDPVVATRDVVQAGEQDVADLASDAIVSARDGPTQESTSMDNTEKPADVVDAGETFEDAAAVIGDPQAGEETTAVVDLDTTAEDTIALEATVEDSTPAEAAAEGITTSAEEPTANIDAEPVAPEEATHGRDIVQAAELMLTEEPIAPAVDNTDTALAAEAGVAAAAAAAAVASSSTSKSRHRRGHRRDSRSDSHHDELNGHRTQLSRHKEDKGPFTNHYSRAIDRARLDHEKKVESEEYKARKEEKRQRRKEKEKAEEEREQLEKEERDKEERRRVRREKRQGEADAAAEGGSGRPSKELHRYRRPSLVGSTHSAGSLRDRPGLLKRMTTGESFQGKGSLLFVKFNESEVGGHEEAVVDVDGSLGSSSRRRRHRRGRDAEGAGQGGEVQGRDRERVVVDDVEEGASEVKGQNREKQSGKREGKRMLSGRGRGARRREKRYQREEVAPIVKIGRAVRNILVR